MRPPTFLEGVSVALAISLAGGVFYTVMDAVFPGVPVLRLLIAGIGLIYVVYLLNRSPDRVGRVTAVAAWLLVAGALWFTQPPLLLYLCVHLGTLWLIRSLYFYSSALSALADLGLNGLGLAAAIWAVTRTGSIFLGIWCFFLVQALFVVIPKRINRRPGTARAGHENADRFQHAYRVAEAAVRKLSSNH
ncbi:MAG: hypothetical protein QNL87_02790 [Gammaproteobacteria bacterium]|nr:hypothetical protein [Gammaproteobacteria bacterium]